MIAFTVLKNISLCTSSITIVLGTFCLLRSILSTKNQSLFFYYLILCAFSEIINLYGAYVHRETLMLIPLFSVLELVLFYLYFKTLVNSRILNGFVFAGILLCHMDVSIIYRNPTASVFVLSRVFNSLFFILCALYSSYKFTLSPRLLRLNFSIILYFSFTFIYFLVLNFLINIQDHKIFILWIAYSLLCVLFHLFLFVDSWKYGKIPKY